MNWIAVLATGLFVPLCAATGALGANPGENDMTRSIAATNGLPTEELLSEAFPDPACKDSAFLHLPSLSDTAGGGLAVKDIAIFSADLRFDDYPSSALNGTFDAQRNSDGSAIAVAAASDVGPDQRLTVETRGVADASPSGENMMRNFSAYEPMASSGPPVPAPLAGWISLVGLLGVVVLRWFRLARRFWTTAT